MSRTMQKTGNANHLRNRQSTLNQVARGDAAINRQQRRPEEEKRKRRTPKQGRHRSNVFFNTDHLVNLMCLATLVTNTITRALDGLTMSNLRFIISNVIFVVLYMFMASYIDPRRMASDNTTHIRPNMNTLYARVRQDAQGGLQRVGENLDLKAISSINLIFIMTIITTLIAMFTWNSNMTALVIPMFGLYLARGFAGNSFKEDAKNIGVYKWILFVLLLIQSLYSVYGSTMSYDYSLFVVISVMNSVHIFAKYTLIYGRHEVPGEIYE